MIITIETSNIQEVEQLLSVLKSMDISKITIKDTSVKRQPTIVKGNKVVNPRTLFGIWQKKPLTLEQIRSLAWRRNTNS